MVQSATDTPERRSDSADQHSDANEQRPDVDEQQPSGGEEQLSGDAQQSEAQPHELTTHAPAATENDTTEVEEDATTAPIQRPPKTTVTLINVANILDPAISNNPVLSAAIQVLDQISEVGKVLPFVAPAFVLLKIIIDLEKRSHEVDAKCNDLLERIAFMMSHIPVLEQVEITPTIRAVIDRINKAMEDATTLIGTYHNQGRVARRLRLSNRDKFAACVDSINNCSNDLLISLQIHQTVQLGDILTRPVPTDAGDAAAAKFVSTKGGSVDDVVHNSDLVGQFAQQQHLIMDDTVMEQLNANITELLQQNHARLEDFLHENVNSAIVDGFRNISWDMLSFEAEPQFVCVQCEKEFTKRSNSQDACSYHLTDEYRTKKRLFECCNDNVPCQTGTHRAKHHCDYPYANFFLWVRRMTNTSSQWASVIDTDLDTNASEGASVGQIFSWPQATPLTEKALYIMIGAIWYRGRYYFNTFTASELSDINETIRATGETVIFRTSPDENQYAMAEWVISELGEITGIQISAKSATSTQPNVQLCPIDLATCFKGGEVVTISTGGLRSYTPSSPYVLPPPVRVGPELIQGPTRAIRTDFVAQTSSKLPVILKSMANPPLVANPEFSRFDSDLFHGNMSLFNNNVADSHKPISIMSVSAQYRLIGDPDYAPVESCQLLEANSDVLPVTVDPRQSWKFKFVVTIPRTEEDAQLGVSWKNRAFLARYRPLRVKIFLEDVEGEICSLVMEYVYMPNPTTFKQPNPNDLHLLYFDNDITFDRHHVHISEDVSRDVVINIHGAALSPTKLERAVYAAMQTGITEIDLGIGQELWPGDWAWSAWALIDLRCQHVYAFKILLHDGKKYPEKHFGALYYIPCPPYGKPSEEIREIQYASDDIALPPLEDYFTPLYRQDDDLDDLKPAPAPAPAPVADSSPASLPSPASSGLDLTLVTLSERLASVDSNLTALNMNLSRLAVAFEKFSERIPS